MSAHNLPYNYLTAPWGIPDPGNAGTFANDNKGRAFCAVKTAGAETRTVKAPSTLGQILELFMDTDAGDCTITVNNGQGVTTLVLDDVGDYVVLEAITVGGSLKWRVNLTASATGGEKTVTVNCVLNSGCVDQAFFTADRPYLVTRVDEIHAVAGNDAGAVNLQVVKDTGTAAPGAGTDLLTNNANAGFDMKATANTIQNGALVAAEATKRLAVGDRLSLDYAGVVTTLAGVQVTVTLQAI